MNPPVFITGQQIGLLGGPLYTTYKVLGTVNIAEKRKGIAVYWLETNDADFNEINHIVFPGMDGELKRLVWDIPSNGFSTGLLVIDKSLIDILTNFFNSLRQTEFTPLLRSIVFDSYREGSLLKDASRLLAERLYGRFDIRIFDPTEKEFREFSRPILLKEAGKTLTGGQCNLFCMMGSRRLAVFKTASGYRLRDGTEIVPDDYELVPNVKTRNLCQDAFFNTDTYIAGPGEIIYISDLDDQYRYHNIKKADILPRISLTLIEPKVKRLLRKYNLEAGDVIGTGIDDFRKKLVTASGGSDWGSIKKESERLTNAYLNGLSDLNLPARNIRKDIIRSVKEMVGTGRKAEKERMTGVIRDSEYLSNSLFPNGQKQERVFNLFYYLNLYGGTALIDRILENYNRDPGTLEL